MKKRLSSQIALLAACLLLGGSGCSTSRSGNQQSVVVYCSLDQNYAEPILKDFERASGVRVLPVYDTEAAKTVGLVTGCSRKKTTREPMCSGIQKLCARWS